MQMKKKLDDARAIAMEMAFQINDGTIAFLPDRFFIDMFIRETLAAQDFRMNADDQYLFVI
jgi:hypothetical protein